MAEAIFEFIFELIFEGLVETAGSRRVPMIVRIGAAAFLFLVYFALMGVILIAAICSGSIPFIILALVLAVAVTIAIVVKTVRTLAKR